MEELKNLEKILEPDNRRKPLTLEHIYRRAASIKLHDGVPEKIRSHFATAQNLLVYSWFYYPFNVTAEFVAFVTLEHALRERFKPKEGTSFTDLVRRAVREGLVRDEGFSHIQDKVELDSPFKKELENSPQQIKKYVEILIESIPFLRNELAHGSPMFHPGGGFSVRLCAEFINQLFQP